MKLDRLNDGVIAASGAGGGAIDPGSERSGGLAWANGVSGVAVGLYPPPPKWGAVYTLKWGGVYTLKWGGVYLYSPLVGRAGREYDGVDAAGQAGGGAIDPVVERSGGLAWVYGIGGSAAGQYSPPFFS